MIFWFFGYPGVGKDFWAERLSRITGIPHVDVDNFLTEDDKQKLREGTFSSDDRLRKLSRASRHLESLGRTRPHMAAADSLPDRASQQFLLDRFGDNIRFMLVTAPQSAHRRRLREREEHFFTQELLDDWLKKHWEPVDIPHVVLLNKEGDEDKNERKLLRMYRQAAHGAK